MNPPIKPMLLAPWDGEDTTGWMISEKLDGLRAIWTGSELLSREGHPFRAPQWFRDAMPKGVALDGELFGGRGTLAKVSGMFRRKVPIDSEWKRVQFHVFDSPSVEGPVADRITEYRRAVTDCNPSVIVPVVHVPCGSIEHMARACSKILAVGGEGVVVRHPSAHYVHGRTGTALKFRPIEFLHHRILMSVASN